MCNGGGFQIYLLYCRAALHVVYVVALALKKGQEEICSLLHFGGCFLLSSSATADSTR